MFDADKILEQIQSFIQTSSASWTANHTSISALSEEQHKMIHGYVPGPNELSLEEREKRSAQRPAAAHKSRSATGAVSGIDWRNISGRNYVTSVEHQSLCGACAAFGVAATMETQARIVSNIALNDPNGASLPQLSEAHLFFSGADHNCLTGWNVEGALKFAQQTGVVPLECCPYTLGDIFSDRAPLCDGWQSKVTQLTSHTVLDDVQAMKRWLATRGPLITCFSTYVDFLFYSSGVFTKSIIDLPFGGHCVSCIGYDDAKQAWLCKNSWGPDWGESGFFWIGYGQCGIDATMWGIDGFKTIYKTQ